MTHDEAIALLTADGDLAVPCSRYGTRSSDCAEVAWLAALAVQEANGDPITFDLLDHLMGLVVNDHADIAHLVNDLSHDWAYRAAEESAERLGAEAGTAAGSWVTDGNTTTETYRALLAGLDDGDPIILDQLPYLDLSGQWADGPRAEDIFRDIMDDADTSTDPDADTFGEIVDDLVSIYETAYNDAMVAEVERACRAQLIPYATRDIGYGVEEGEVFADPLGPADWTGKRPYARADGVTLYLFDDEVS